MGTTSFTDVTFLLIKSRLPEPNEKRLLDTVLVALMEHGLTLSAAAARMTYWVDTQSLQSAVAAGLLGAGRRVLGSMEECGELLTRIDDAVVAGSSRQEAAAEIVSEYRAAKKRLPGIGHAIHTEGDPRAARLFEVAAECDLRGSSFDSLVELNTAAEQAVGRTLPVNATGAIAASLLALEVPWQLHRGFALISRTAGLVAHIGEEIENPITPEIRKILLGTD
jgi:citrate synthase